MRYKKILITVLVVVAMLGYDYWRALNKLDAMLRRVIDSQQTWVDESHEQLVEVFGEVFEEASECWGDEQIRDRRDEYGDDCTWMLRKRLDELIGRTLASGVRGGRKPVYFVKLTENNKLAKLYQSGIYFEEEVESSGEESVVQILKGEKDPFEFPLYTCDGGDDWVCELLLPGRLLLPDRIYLEDMYSEIELYFLVKGKGEIVGAVVYLHGD